MVYLLHTGFNTCTFQQWFAYAMRLTHLRCLKDDSESTEDIIQELLIYFSIQVTNEDVCTHIQIFCVRRSLDRDSSSNVINWLRAQQCHEFN